MWDVLVCRGCQPVTVSVSCLLALPWCREPTAHWRKSTSRAPTPNLSIPKIAIWLLTGLRALSESTFAFVDLSVEFTLMHRRHPSPTTDGTRASVMWPSRLTNQPTLPNDEATHCTLLSALCPCSQVHAMRSAHLLDCAVPSQPPSAFLPWRVIHASCTFGFLTVHHSNVIKLSYSNGRVTNLLHGPAPLARSLSLPLPSRLSHWRPRSAF